MFFSIGGWAQRLLSLSGKGSDINTPASEDYICFLFFHFKDELHTLHAHVCSGTHAQMWRPEDLQTASFVAHRLTIETRSLAVGRLLAIILAGSRDLPVSALSRLGLQTVMVLGVGVGDSNSGPHDCRAGVYSVGHLS